MITGYTLQIQSFFFDMVTFELDNYYIVVKKHALLLSQVSISLLSIY